MITPARVGLIVGFGFVVTTTAVKLWLDDERRKVLSKLDQIENLLNQIQTKLEDRNPDQMQHQALVKGIEQELEAILAFLDTIRGDGTVKTERKRLSIQANQLLADKIDPHLAR